MVAIKQDMAGRTDRQTAGTNPCTYITVHETDNTSRGAGAQAHANYQKSGGGGASWHYQVDDKGVIQSYPDTRRLWHAGDGRGNGNMSSIGIETCVNPDSNWATTKENLAQLISTLMSRHGIPISRVVQHNHWSGKNCPRNMRANGNAQWNQVIARVKALQGGAKPSTPTPSAGGIPTSGAHTGSLTKTDKQLELRVDGSLGGSTVARWQQVMGTPIDGVISKNSQLIAAFQRFLNKELGAAHVKNLTGKTALAVDGTLGPATTKAWQFWSANRFPGHLKNIKGWTLTSGNFGQWVDGSFGPNTIRMLQAALNESYANSGKIGAK